MPPMLTVLGLLYQILVGSKKPDYVSTAAKTDPPCQGDTARVLAHLRLPTGVGSAKGTAQAAIPGPSNAYNQIGSFLCFLSPE